MYPITQPELQDWLCSLHDGQWFGFDGEHIYTNLIIHNKSCTKPTEQECIDGLKAMQDAWKARGYARNRAAEYPSITDYIDGVVKGDQAQIDKYIADCLAVKAKYPKGAA